MDDVGVVMKMVAVGASFIAEAYFGLYVVKLAPLQAVVTSLIIGLGFLWALGQFSVAERKKDVFDTILWLATICVFGAYLSVISIESVISQAADSATWVNIFPSWFGQLAKQGYAMAISIFALIFVITFVSRIVDIKLGNNGGFSCLEQK